MSTSDTPSIREYLAYRSAGFGEAHKDCYAYVCLSSEVCGLQRSLATAQRELEEARALVREQGRELGRQDNELEEARADSRRLDWLLSKDNRKMGVIEEATDMWVFDRAEIDRAMEARK